MPKVKEKPYGVIKFQSQEDINKKNQEERRKIREQLFERAHKILNNDIENRTK